ncbi:MAG: hypothetical protein B5M48_00960 [Candidatus Omnitrophica bacterium 4484_213]|nr:MAG: hypothetical protein B5M48_00960 [Candidatus Omnitrophica bacterium 4484_213]
MKRERRRDKKVVNLGFENLVFAERIVAIVTPDSAPVKRLISEVKRRGKLVDVTNGRKTRAVIITDSDYIILSSVQPESLKGRL